MLDEAMIETWYRRFQDALLKKSPFRISDVQRLGGDARLMRDLRRIYEFAAGGAVSAVDPLTELSSMYGAARLSMSDGACRLYALPCIINSERLVSSAFVQPRAIPPWIVAHCEQQGWTSLPEWVTVDAVRGLAVNDVFTARSQRPQAAAAYLRARLAPGAKPFAFRSHLHLRYVILVGPTSLGADAFLPEAVDQLLQDACWAGAPIEIVATSGSPDGFFRSINYGHMRYQARALPLLLQDAQSVHLQILDPDDEGVCQARIMAPGHNHGWRIDSCPYEDSVEFCARLTDALRPLSVLAAAPGRAAFFIPV